MKFAIFLAEGYEEGEAIIIGDVLRRSGQIVDLVSVANTSLVKSCHNFFIKSDKKMSAVKYEDYDGFVLPGGLPGVTNLKKSTKLRNMLLQANQDKKIIGAICAAPTILAELKILDGKEATCYPSVADQMCGVDVDNESAAITVGHIITGASVGSAINFALALIDKAIGSDEVLLMQEQLVIRD